MTEDTFSLQAFKHAIVVDCRKDNLFKLIATSQGLCQWFLGEVNFWDDKTKIKQISSDEIPRIGMEYHWKWKAKDFKTMGKVLETNGHSSICYSFGNLFKITFSLSNLKSPSKTRVDFHQTYLESKKAIPNDFAHINCCVCWVFFLTNLKSVVEHGNDLREEDYQDEVLLNR